jgi:hypothetical protein
LGVQGVQEFRSSGVQEFRSSGVQEFRSSGVQEFRIEVPSYGSGLVSSHPFSIAHMEAGYFL